MSNPSYIDKALKRVQDGERRAYMRLRSHLGLSPLPSRPSVSALASSTAAVTPTEALPPVRARNPARGHHYTNRHSDAASCNFSLNEGVKQEQKAQLDSHVAEKSTGSDEEAQIACAGHEKDVDTEEISSVIMDDLSDAIGQALNEWKDASNHK